VVGVIAEVGAGALCAVITGGAGSVLCGAIGGLVSALVTDGLKCYGGEADRCSAKTLLTDAAIGIGSGMLGAGLGGGLSATVKSAAQKSTEPLRKFGIDLVTDTLRDMPKTVCQLGLLKRRVIR
jgi:hypothetical protein